MGILWALFVVCVAMFAIAIEKWLFLQTRWRTWRAHWIVCWSLKQHQQTWYGHQIQQSWLAQGRWLLYRRLRFLKCLVGLCPMLGLLGTVTGMIALFDALSFGHRSFSALSQGIALATIPTLVGMSLALIGLVLHGRLVRMCQRKLADLEKGLRSR